MMCVTPYKNFSILLCSAMLGMVVSQPVFAVDGDYVIPYTDNYGYVYDPKTGTYIQQSQPADTIQSDSVQPQNQAATPAAAADPAPFIQAEQTTSPAPQQTSTLPLPAMAIGILILLGLLFSAYRFFKIKRVSVD